MTKGSSEQTAQKGVGASTSSFRYKLAVFILGCLVALTVGGYLLLTREVPPVRVGESQTYDIYVGGEKIGSLTLQVTDTAIVENVECYVARYSLTTANMARSGLLKFDKEGNLRRAVIAEAENLSLKWRTEVGYSPAQKIMRVIVQDNRDPENYSENDVIVGLTAEIMMPEYIWYLVRFEALRLGFRHEFNIHLLPNALLNVKCAIKVTGEETVETPAGRFDCWALGGENTRLSVWPVDKLWISKKGKLVVKAVEFQNDVQVEYVLKSKE